jgi:flagellar assembly factor FliW
LAFLVTDPANYVGDYAPPLSNTIAESLEIWEETPRMVLTTVNIPPGKPEEMTINLAGPLLVNAISRKGKQIVLEDDAYTTRYRVFHTADRMGDIVAA